MSPSGAPSQASCCYYPVWYGARTDRGAHEVVCCKYNINGSCGKRRLQERSTLHQSAKLDIAFLLCSDCSRGQRGQIIQHFKHIIYHWQWLLRHIITRHAAHPVAWDAFSEVGGVQGGGGGGNRMHRQMHIQRGGTDLQRGNKNYLLLNTKHACLVIV